MKANYRDTHSKVNYPDIYGRPTNVKQQCSLTLFKAPLVPTFIPFLQVAVEKRLTSQR